ncbi:WEB family protein At1g12150 [Rhodamnia argentea]|uniref:WEB family protein At1g12150 n=1 Tax=Rhodamnia argentea TaxID=178133 RepID=A0ABM3H569_9MYRT|nr:WEB family protein At1g12150 [Rhodamnia argentea]XP_048131742.1 WEB family protein At1g12150 [Rhodamnia argentea]
MVNIRIKDNQNSAESPRAEVGEIDTRAPFQSVKAAVSLFGEVASKKKPTIKRSKTSSENVLDKETQLLLAQKELNRIKQQLENAETTKARALSDLGKANRTVQELTTKLNSAIESKQAAIEATETVKHKAKHLERVKSQNLERTSSWKKELGTTRDEYRRAAAELNTAKQELTKIRQDFDATLEAKLAAFQQAAEAQRSAKVNSEKASELSKEIQAMRQSLDHLKATSLQAEKEQAKFVEEKEARLKDCKIAKEEAEEKLLSLKTEFDPEQMTNLELKLVETTEEIEVLQNEMKKVHASDMDSVKVITTELNNATKALQKVAEEESFCRERVNSLRQELEDIKAERIGLEAREAELECTVKTLQAELDEQKQELHVASREEKEIDDAADEKTISLAIQKTMQEAEEMRRAAEELKREAGANRVGEGEAEKMLEAALKEAEVAKAAEKSALDQIKILSAKTDVVSASDPDASGWIRMSVQEFESLSRKVEESANLAEMKLAAAAFQMEAMNTKKSEAEKRKEVILKEIEEIKEATEFALKQAEMAEAAKKAIEGELTKRHQQEQDN